MVPPVMLQILGEIDVGHAAMTNFLLDLVAVGQRSSQILESVCHVANMRLGWVGGYGADRLAGFGCGLYRGSMIDREQWQRVAGQY